MDPIETVKTAKDMFENGPLATVAAFFAVAFFASLYWMMRTKDAARAELKELQLDHANRLAEENARHAEEMAALYQEEKDRAIKHEVTMSKFIEMIDDFRFIAFEMRRSKALRERKKEDSQE